MKRMFVAAAVLAAVALTGCTSVDAKPGVDVVGTNAPAQQGTKAPANTQAPKPADDGTATFGSTYTWDDGLSVSISKPSKFKPSEWAAGSDTYSHAVQFEIKIVNKTGKPWDPVMSHMSLQSSNKEGEQIFDSGKLGEMPTTKLLNGRELTYKVAFGVQDPADLVAEFTPDFEHDSVLYQK